MRIFFGIRFKRFVFAVKKLYPAVRHGAERRNAETAVADGAGSADAAADICGTRAINGAVKALCTAGAELHNRSAVRSAHDAVCLRCDEALVVDGQQNHGLHKLCLNDRAAHGDDRLTREDRRALRHSPNIAGKLEVLQIIEKLFAKNVLGAQVIDILLRERKLTQVIDELLHACHNGKSAAVRHFAEKHIKVADGILKTVGKIAVCHSDLIEIRQHGQVNMIVREILCHNSATAF